MATVEEEVKPTRRELTRAQIGLLVGGLVLLLIVFWFLFLRGGGEEEAPVTAPEPVVTSPAPLEEPDEPAREPGKQPVENFEVFAPRDPFKPLVDVSGGGEAGETTGEETTDGETAGEDVDGDGDVDEDDGVATDVTGDDEDSTENVEGHRVKLVATMEDGKSAQIQVDDTVYTAEKGEVFAENFKLVSVSDECATLLYGDDQFSLCEGEEILK